MLQITTVREIKTLSWMVVGIDVNECETKYEVIE